MENISQIKSGFIEYLIDKYGEEESEKIESYTREECNNGVRSPPNYYVKQAWLIVICFPNLTKQVNHLVGFSKIIKYVIIFCIISKFFELVFESSALLKKTMKHRSSFLKINL